MRSAGDSTIRFDHKRTVAFAQALGHEARRRVRRYGAAIAAQRERWILTLPLPLALGIALYHALPAEPPPALAASAGLAAVAGLVAAGRSAALARRALLVALALTALGFALAQAQTLRLAQPPLDRAVTTDLEGRVVLVEPRAEGARLTLDVVPRRPDFPHRVRITTRALDAEPHVGDLVRATARLLPPSEPVIPGGFDFARWAYFNGIGAVGYAYGAVEIAEAAPAGGFAMAEVRRWIARHVVDVVPGDAGGVAAALLTGLRGDIPDHVWAAMQGAGLAHLLAISGLHVGLVAGTAFVVVRYAVALWPWLALRLIAHRVAAVAALVVAFFYLLLAGAPLPTQRAFMMTGIVLVGLMLDRDAISLRLVAFAACVVLAVDPAALFGASFQMSFAAVVGLVAVYERWRMRRTRRGDPPPRLILAYFVGVALTTIIATLATAPFVAFHFGRVATYGNVANLIAVPLMALWIMPLGLLSLMLMPFGLDEPFLRLMGWGLDVVLWSAEHASSWPGAAIVMPPPPGLAILLLSLAGLWAALWFGRLPRLALVPALAGLVVWGLARPPDLVVDRRAQMAAFRLGPGVYALAVDDRDGFVLRGWERVLGIEGFVAPEGPVACDRRGCRYALAGREIAVAFRPNALLLDCEADLVLNLATDQRCATTPTVTRGEFWRNGALALRAGEPASFDFVYESGDRRPWERQR